MEKSGGNLWVSGLGQAVTRILLFRLLDCLSDKNSFSFNVFVKLRQGSGKDRQGMALKAKGLKA